MLKYKTGNANGNLFVILSLLILSSCIPFKKTIFLRDKGSKFGDTISTSLTLYKVQPNDVLSLNVTSFHKEVSEFYNLKDDGGQGGFLVKPNGYIHIPMLDSIFVKDLTIPEIELLVSKSLSERIANPYVLVKLVNFKIIFLGEVGSPGVVNSKENILSIYEGLALAGDFNEVANRTKVKIVRKMSNGANQIIRLDLTSKDIMASPYYYLQPNDIVYVEPVKAKNLRTNFQTFSIILSLTTFAIVITNYLKAI